MGNQSELKGFNHSLQVLQLKLSASPKSPRDSSSTNERKPTKEDELDDDDDDDIEDPETLNRTLTEIIDGKRSSTSLLALLNKEDTDSESVLSSSSSETSTSIHKGRLIRTPSLSSKTNGSDISSIPEVTCEGDLENANETLENSAIDQGQFREVDLSSETGYELNSANGDKSDAGSENQSGDITVGSNMKTDDVTVNHFGDAGIKERFEINKNINGDDSVGNQSVTDSNEVQFCLETNEQRSSQTLLKPDQNMDDKLKTLPDMLTTNQT